MEGNDDIDEDELALAMSTELSRPTHTITPRRARSATSLRNTENGYDHSNLTNTPVPGISPSKNFDQRPIKIQDRSLSSQDKDNPDGLWASSVTVTEPSIVKGNQSKGLQAVSGYVVWVCTVVTFEGRVLKTHKRYSEFFSLRQSLCAAFPRYEKFIPNLPPKSVVSKFRPAFLEKRRRGLEFFLSTVLLMPELGASPIVKRVRLSTLQS